MRYYFALMAFVIITVKLQAQEEPSVFSKIADKVTLSGDVQFRYEHSFTDSINVQGNFAADPVQSNFRVRRARLRADAKITEKLSLTTRIALQEFSNPDNRVIEYAYFNYAFSEFFQIRAGQDKSPFGLEELRSSNNLPVIDRGPTTNLFVDNNYAAFQQGVMIHGKHKNKILPFNYAAGIYNGNGRIRNDNNSGKNLVGRLELIPIKGFQIGVNGQWADIKGDQNATAYGIDLLIDKYFTEKIGFLVMTEYLKGDNILMYENAAILPKDIDNYEMQGWYVVALLKLKPETTLFRELEIGAKYEQLDPLESLTGNSLTQITPNIGITFLKDNAARWQFNLVHTNYENEVAGERKNNLLFVTQFQVRF